MTELQQPVKAKKKVPFFDRTIVVLISTFVMLTLGQLLGITLITNGLRSAAEALIPGITASDAWITAEFYFCFLGIWAVVLPCIAIRPSSRPILKTLWKGLSGNTLKMFGVGLAIGLGMNLLCAFVAMLHGDISLSFVSFRPVSFLLIFVSVLIQSAAEERVCRSYLYEKLMKRYRKPLLATIVNAAFFMAIHLGNPGINAMSLLNIFLYGLLFSAIMIYMDSLWAAMAAHAAWNFCQNILLGLPNSGLVTPYSVFRLDAASATNSFAYNTGFGLEGTITACLVLGIVAAGILWWGIRNKKQPTNIWLSAAEQ